MVLTKLPFKPKKRTQSETSLQIQVSSYLKIKYPDVIFTSESSGTRLTIGQAMKAKRMRSDGCLPDMIILEPRSEYHGLVLELKFENNSPFLKDGSISKDKHVQEQFKMLLRLDKKGYYAKFAVGFKDAIRIIDMYMSWD